MPFQHDNKMININVVLACLPLLPPGILLARLIGNPLQVLQQDWFGDATTTTTTTSPFLNEHNIPPPVSSQLLAYLVVATFGYIVTYRLVPNIQQYTLRKGISGKDLGKKGTSTEDKDIPEALGIVPGAVFLVCLIFCLVGYAHTNPSKLLDVNSALLSICFMLFLGFTDDVLDWPWRYKLILPTVASLPLLCCYNGSTSIVMPIQLRPLLWRDGSATLLGNLLGYFIVIDAQSDGRVIETGYWYLLYMGMLAVFCTNAINIYAGINGLEAGQSFVIACAVLVHNLWEISLQHQLLPNHLFSAMLMLSFVGVTLGLLRHNWFPASVFVGDTFCYFSGMTFAVVGILGHFSKTLLLFFIPQIINFLWSCPQLFKIIPCPRHRLPRLDPKTGLLQPSTFPCRADQYKWLKRHADDTQCPNMTVISLCLQFFGPMSERNLCVALLALQALSCAAGLFGRYFLARFFFES